MATNRVAWVGNLYGAKEPLIMLGNFAAGSTAAIKRGEIIELTGNTNTEWVPLDSDFDPAGNLAVMNEEIKASDRAGYYEIIVPRPGDIFEFELAAAAATVLGAELFYSTSQKLAASGTNEIGVSVGQENYPQKQGHLTDEPSGDAGTTIRSQSYVRMHFKLAGSYYAFLVK